MEAKTSGMQKTVDKSIENYSRTAHDAVDRAAEAASSVASRLGERVDALSEKGSEIMELPQDWMDGARDYVREHPFQAVGIALAAGYLLSMMMRRSPDRE